MVPVLTLLFTTHAASGKWLDFLLAKSPTEAYPKRQSQGGYLGGVEKGSGLSPFCCYNRIPLTG